MIRKEIVKKLSQKTGNEPAAIQIVVDAILTVIFATLKAGEEF